MRHNQCVYIFVDAKLVLKRHTSRLCLLCYRTMFSVGVMIFKRVPRMNWLPETENPSILTFELPFIEGKI